MPKAMSPGTPRRLKVGPGRQRLWHGPKHAGQMADTERHRQGRQISNRRTTQQASATTAGAGRSERRSLIGLVVLTVFDLFVMFLTWHEYQLICDHLPTDPLPPSASRSVGSEARSLRCLIVINLALGMDILRRFLAMAQVRCFSAYRRRRSR